MTKQNPPQDDDHAASLAAAEWLSRRDRGFTPAEQDAFFVWLAASPRHGEWLARHQRTWRELNSLAEWRPENSAEPNPDLLARPARSHRVSKWLIGSLSLAAALALIWAANRPSPPPATAPVAAISITPTPTHGPRVVPLVPLQLVANDYTRRVLSDGSVVEMNKGAAIELGYNADVRRVRLVRGEASFTVAKNPNRPFIVRAGGIDVRAVGTVFNVRLDARTVEVLVTEGKVEIDDAARGGSLLSDETPLLQAGQKVVVETAPIAPVTAADIAPDEVERRLAWKPAMLEFDQLPLGMVVAEFNQHSPTKIEFADASLVRVSVVASFRAENLEGFVRLLELSGTARVERVGNIIRLHAPR